MVSTLEQMQFPNGTGPGIRRSKCPLLASRTRYVKYHNKYIEIVQLNLYRHFIVFFFFFGWSFSLETIWVYNYIVA